MKKILLLGLSALLTTSCSTDDITSENQPETTDTWTHISLPNKDNAKTFGTFNALGYGYDVTGQYADENSARLQIIDTDKFKAEHSDRLSEEKVLSQEATNYYGKDAATFSKVISQKVSATEQYNVFGETIPFSSAILSNKKFDPAFIYGSYSYIIKLTRFRFNATTELLTEYVTPQFSKDIAEKSAEEIIKKYGTHIATDIYTGGIVDQIFQAKTTNLDRDRAARLGVKMFTFSSENETDIADASKNYEKRLMYKMRGGDQNLAVAGIYNLDRITPSLNYSNWQSTLKKENAVLVDFGNYGLINLYDLVKDPIKKAQIKQYTNQYIIENEVIVEL